MLITFLYVGERTVQRIHTPYCMDQGPSSESNRLSASQEIPLMLWNTKVHYRTHKCPPSVLILSQLYRVHAFTSHFLETHLNIILPSTPGSSKCSLSIRLPHKKTCIRLNCPPIHATCTAHIIILDMITRRIFGEDYRSLSSSLCNYLRSPVTSSLLCQPILLSNLFPNTLGLCSSLNVSDQVLHPYKSKG